MFIIFNLLIIQCMLIFNSMVCVKRIVLCSLRLVRNMLLERMVWVSFCKSTNVLFSVNIISDIFMALYLIDMLPLSLKDLCFQSTSLMGCQFQVSLTLYGIICFISL